MTKILVIGDSCTDIYTYCKSSRLAPDKPVPILEVEEVRSCPGMAYNVFCNAASLCGEEVDMATNDNYKDVTKNRYVDKASNHMFFRLDSSVPIERIDGVEDLSFDYETIVISDYDKGFLTEDDIEQICENHHRVFLDTKKVLGPWARAAKLLRLIIMSIKDLMNLLISILKIRLLELWVMKDVLIKTKYILLKELKLLIYLEQEILS